MGRNFNVQKALSAGMTPGQIQSYVSQNNLIADAPIPGVSQPQVLSAQAPQSDFNSSVGNFINNNVIKPTVDTLSTPLKSILGLTVQTPLTGLYKNAVETETNPNAPKFIQQGAKSGADLLNSILQPLSKATEYTPENQNKTVQQAEKQVANLPALVSYGIPFGKTGIPGSRYFLPGLLTGGLNNLSGQLKEQLNNGQDLNPSQINMPQLEGAAVTGGVTGQVTGSAMDLLGGILGKAGNIGNKIEETGQAVRGGVSKIHEPAGIYGASREKAIENTLNDLGIQGNAQQKYEQLLPAYQELSDKIENELTSNPKNIPIDQIKKDLTTNLSKNLTLDLNGQKANDAVDKFIQNVYKSAAGVDVVPENISSADLFALKQNINKDYGTIASKLQNGTPLSETEKVIYTARKTIDDLIAEAHPQVKQMTTMQSHLYDAADSLNKSRKTVPTFRAFGTTIPTSLQQRIQDAAGSGIQNIGGALNNTGNLGNAISNSSPLLSKILALTLTGGNGSQNSQNTNNNSNTDSRQNNSASNFNHTTDYSSSGQQYQTTSNEITPEMVTAAKLYLPSQLADRVEAAYKAQSGGATAQQAGLVRAGLRNVNDVEQMLKEDPNLLAKQLLPGKIASRKFDSALYDAADSLLRLRTGATANPSEIKAYAQSIAPSFGDSPEVIQYKLAKLRSDLNSYIGK